ncbi:MAG: glycosyl hydrolase-related protein, partial [Bacteroidota bacterium]
DTVRQAFQLNAPLRAVVGQSGTEQVAVSVEPAGAILESLKQAEDGDGWILRVYEAHGGSCDIEITLPVEPARVSACDLMERPSDEALRAEGRCIHAVLKPYEIRSFRVEFE